LILRIRNFTQHQGDKHGNLPKRDWPYRKISRVDTGAFANLPAYVRGYALQMVQKFDPPLGDLDCGDEAPGVVVRRRIGGHPFERKMINKAVDLLLEEGFILRLERAHEDRERDLAEASARLVRGTTAAPPRHERGSTLQSNGGNCSTPKPQVSKKVSKKDSTSPEVGSAPLCLISTSGSTASPEGMTTKPAEHQAVVDHFHVRFVERFGVKPTWNPKQLGIAKRLRKAHGADEVIRRIDALFDSAPDWIVRDGFDIGTLEAHFDKLGKTAAEDALREREAAIEAETQRRIREALGHGR